MRLVRLARLALPLDGVDDLSDVSLLISVIPHRKVVRVAYDASFTYGRRGACWYDTHHAFARLASEQLGVVLHAYVFDADEYEQVATWEKGARVGGERLLIHEFELPDDDDVTDASFERARATWPLGRLAHLFGVTRDELVRMPRYATSVWLDLMAPSAGDVKTLEGLLAPHPARAFA